MIITSEFFSFNVWHWFLHSSVLERTEFDLSKINWLRDVILFNPIVWCLGQVSIVSYSYHTYFGFLGSGLNLDCGLCDHVITRFASSYICVTLLSNLIYLVFQELVSLCVGCVITRIWLYNLFLFILPFYEVSMVCRFTRVTRVFLVYKFDRISSFFLIELDFFIIYFSLI
jgi:hypothetical protein